MTNLTWLTLTLTLIIPLAAAEGEPLDALPQSDALAANLAWHRETGENEVRTSWFLNGSPNVAMVCTANLSAAKVTTSREVYDWAQQATKTRELSDAQVKTLAMLAKGLPASAKLTELKDAVPVSVQEKGKVKTYLYDRLAPPREVVRLYDLTGALLGTE